jgi:hypothetical protein
MNTEQFDKKHPIKKIKPKRPLILDIDDVVLNSCEAIVEIINERYNLSPKIIVDNIKDWDFTYFTRRIQKENKTSLTKEDYLKLFESVEFWEKVQFKEGIMDILFEPKIRDYFKITLVSTGTQNNLEAKEKFLFKQLDMTDINFIGLPLDLKNPQYNKKEIDNFMLTFGGIQVDDRYKCLNTNAKLKVLLKNNKETTYNQVLDMREDLYVVNDLKELKEILMFIIEADDEYFKDFPCILK